MSSSNLLKIFGKGADVALQLANDKALRRKSTGTVRGFDITSGELLEGLTVVNGPNPFPHTLRRDAVGGLVLAAESGAEGDIFVESASATEVVVRASTTFTNVTVWVV